MAEKMSGVGKDAVAKQYIGFMLGEEEFTAPLALIQEIIEIPPITYVPNVPVYVEGVINLRGRVVPVVDLKKRLGLGQMTVSIDSRIIFFRIKGRIVGFIVNAISQVYELADQQIEPPSEVLVTRSDSRFIVGICKLANRLPLLLDIPKILESSQSEYAAKKQRQSMSDIAIERH